jgi:hypothetical protein
VQTVLCRQCCTDSVVLLSAQQQLIPDDNVPSHKYHITLAKLPKIADLLLPEIYKNYNYNYNYKHEINEFQKKSILGTARTLRKVLR